MSAQSREPVWLDTYILQLLRVFSPKGSPEPSFRDLEFGVPYLGYLLEPGFQAVSPTEL
jgi:hypothetical protein